MTEPIQVGDGFEQPDPVIESWKKALDMFIKPSQDFEGSAKQIAEAFMIPNSLLFPRDK